MALTLNSTFATDNETGTDVAHVLERPAEAVNGTTIFIAVMRQGSQVPTPPPGFQLVPGASIINTNSLWVFYKLAGSSEPDEYYVYWGDGLSGSTHIFSIAPSGGNFAMPHAVATNYSAAASTDKVWNEVNNTVANTLLICIGGWSSSGGSTVHAGMTERRDIGGSASRLYVMTQAVAATGLTGSRTATGTSATLINTITLSIEESATDTIADLPVEAHVTELPVLVEMDAEGAEVTEFPVLVELAAQGVYLTEYPVIVELGAVGVYVTELPVLVELEEFTPEAVLPTYYPKAAGTRAIHTPLPDEVTGYPLDPEYSWWATVVPEKGRNMLYNPSFEVDGDEFNVYDDVGFSAFDYLEFGIVGATSGKQCARLTVAVSPNNTLTNTGDLTAIGGADGYVVTPGAYTWSLDVYFSRPPGIFQLWVTDENNTRLYRKSFVIDTTGWRRVHITWIELGSGMRRFQLHLPAGDNVTGSYVYTDSWQVEAKAYPTIYFDGDFVGFNDLQPNQSFFWEGAPHKSPSVRRANTGAGGRLVSWSDDIGFYTTGIVGLGMGPVNIRTQEMSDGSELHQSSTPTARDFTVTGRIYAENFAVLQEKARELTRLLRPNNTREGSQGILRFQQTDSRGNMVGAPLDIICVYKDGLGGTVNNLYQQQFPIQFRASQPFPIETIESAASLEVSKLLYNNGVIFKDEDGDYVNLGVGDPDAIVRRVDFDPMGRPLAGGPFTLLSGDAVNAIGYWDGTQWLQLSEVGPIVINNVQSIDGGWRYGFPTVVGGDDSFQGGAFEYQSDTDQWEELGDGFNSTSVFKVLRHVDGSVFVGGDFDNNAAASNPELRFIAKYDPNSPGAYLDLDGGLVHTTLNGFVNDMVIHDGYLYVVGLFDETDGGGGPSIVVNNVARWDIENGGWDAMGSGFNDIARGVAVSEDGFIYVVGDFDRDGGDDYDLRGIARWNGNSWEEPFELVDESGDHGADGLALDERGVFWFYKDQTTVDHRFVVSDTIGPSETFGWKNGVFYPSFLRNSEGLWYLSIGPGGRTIMSVLNAEAPASASIGVPAMNLIDYPGDADAPMVVHLHGEMQPIQILNLDMDGGVYFLPDLIVGENEEMVIRTDLQRSLMYSNGRVNLYRYMSSGPSSSLLLHLRPGVNRISVFADDEVGSSGWLTWRNRFWGIEAASSL